MTEDKPEARPEVRVEHGPTWNHKLILLIVATTSIGILIGAGLSGLARMLLDNFPE